MPAAPPLPLRLQRWLMQRAERGHAELPPDARTQAEIIDRFLFSAKGLWAWLALLVAMVANTIGLLAAGFEPWLALLVTLLFFAGLAKAARGAWLRPERFNGRRLWRLAWLMMVASYTGAIASVIGLHHDPLQQWDAERVLQVLWRATPLQLVVGLGVLLTLWLTATARRLQSQRALVRLQLVQERDAAARQASEAQLRLLRAQIQPHFIFNTLSAVQHWVDTRDARASGLLRELTAFLRGSTELLSRSEVTLREEAELLRHYLGIMQARLGERLRFTLEFDDAALAQVLPAGLLITLAENAVEHGIAPALHGGALTVSAQVRAGAFELVLHNTGAPLAPDWRDGVGLANTRERLRHAFGERAVLHLSARPHGTEHGTEARVQIDPSTPDAPCTPPP